MTNPSRDMDRSAITRCLDVPVGRSGSVGLDVPAEVFGEPSWDVLASTYLEPPLAARVGARLGLGNTPTEASLVEALKATG